MRKTRQETRWYLLWFFTAALWTITFLVNLSAGQRDWVVWLQLATIIASLGAGLVNRKRYIKRQNSDSYTP